MTLRLDADRLGQCRLDCRVQRVAAGEGPGHVGICFGLGFRVTQKFDISLGYYRALDNSGTGPFLNPGGEIPGTSVTNSLSESSIQLQFSNTTRGRVY